jgi:DNA polymerase III epsilon subunit-like protein
MAEEPKRCQTRASLASLSSLHRRRLRGEPMDSWVAIDFETANWHLASPCAVGMVRVVDGEIAETVASLIKPPAPFHDFAPYNIGIHGITAEAVSDAPPWEAVSAKIANFVGSAPLVAHNAAFDVGVLCRANSAVGLPWPKLRFACTLVLARVTWTGLTRYKLPYVAAAAGTPLGTNHHQAEADATAAARILLAAQRVHGVGGIEELLHATRVAWGQISPGSRQGCRKQGASRARPPIPGANLDADPTGYFYRKRVCFTGTLGSMSRDEAGQLLAQIGGQRVQNPTRNTDILVLGVQDPRRLSVNQTKSNRQRTAERYLAQGCPIEIIDEIEFLRALETNE